MDCHKADAAEQATWRSSGERPTCPQWHLLGLASASAPDKRRDFRFGSEADIPKWRQLSALQPWHLQRCGEAKRAGILLKRIYNNFRQQRALPRISISLSATSSAACLGLSEMTFTSDGCAARNTCNRRTITFSNESRMA